jgi:hypothetical protein
MIALALVVMILGSCENEPQKIEYSLNDEQLSHLLHDLYFSEAVLMGHQGVQRDSIRALFWLRMSEVYKLDEAALRAEIDKLKSDPEKLKMLFDRVKTEVDSLQ